MTTLEQKSRQLNQHLLVLRRAMEKQQASCFISMSEITGQEMRALMLLQQLGPLMMKNLADRMGLAANSVTSLVDKLEAGGYALRNRREDDRRVIQVEIQAKGLEIVQGLVESELVFCRAMLERLSDQDQDRFLELTAKMISGL